MKTSNKLLFSFLGFAWLSMVGGMLASVHLLESKPFVKDAVVSSTPVDDDYSVVSIQDFGKLALVMSKDTRIERRKISFEGNDEHVSEDVDPYFVEVRDDTLFISNAEIKQYETWTLHVDRQIKSLILNNVTEVNALNAFEYDSLKILASNSSFRLPRDHGLAFLAFKGEAGAHLSVDGIANLEIHLNQSKADITQFLGKVSGELIGAQVSLPKETTEVALKKDTNSKFYFWN
ncbi:hypothetical protein MM213_04835 [Belliella sp. R4-6]|uniref:Auto-transporter adhesin head GIN domain-containing protein n=1 Tax=Belliella alkalica TaxID=1730871 RepID=A0ABS9V8Q2_9BACT|nr:hypothetical protein [Belliella alkalica]MCH7412801.1 hypothetical protein [Belliella alkalica]